ncbi:MAG: DMT family transporter [Candidatus Methanofastidiosa archaeon]|jgi:drug/metabolite transporter (DMT)-like permease|nr:DMT family transporter [Candidatus Methanofastidiosa archaeon]HOM95606.1 DMT family transporter [Methanofastidiosum sp.]HPC81300.1 DMT family transporter [Methanofastidiosum sp.]HRS24934.1 DMT family transporter [Methanofastidiosum sp.]
MKIKTFLELVALVLIWSGSWIAIKWGLTEIPPYSLAFFRFFVACPVIIAITYYLEGKNSLKISKEEIIPFSILGLLGVTLVQGIQVYALNFTSAINSSILINFNVPFIAILALIFLKEPLSKKTAFGIFISFIGAIVIVINGSISGFQKINIGDILIVFTALFWSIYSIVGKKIMEEKTPLSMTSFTFLFGTIFLFPIAFFESKFSFIGNITKLSIGSILYLSLLCSVFAYISWNRSMKSEKASNVAMFLYFVPVVTAIFAWLLLGEVITIFTIIGGALVILGVYFAER